MKKVLSYLPFVVIVLVLIFESAYTLDEEHQAVITTFGEPKLVTNPGFHFKIPIVQKRELVDTTIQGMPIGYVMETDESVYQDALMISSDYNFVNVDFYLEYVVSDPIKALYNSENYINVLNATAQNSIRTVIASYPVDAILTTGKSEIQANILSLLVEQMDNLDIGVTVRSITIQDSEPPNVDVNNAFKAVETAKQNKETKLNNANKYRNENLPRAQAEVDKILQSAEAQKESRIKEAEGQVARFNSMYDEYVKFPTITKQRMFYEAMEDVLPNLKVVIVNPNGGVDTVLPLDSFTNPASSALSEGYSGGTSVTSEEASGEEVESDE